MIIFSDWLMAAERTELAVLLLPMTAESQDCCGEKVNGR
jgi:hypothetical protein